MFVPDPIVLAILTTKTNMFKHDVQPSLSYIRTGFDRCSYSHIICHVSLRLDKQRRPHLLAKVLESLECTLPTAMCWSKGKL